MPKLYATSRRIDRYGFRVQGSLPPIETICIDTGSPRNLIQTFLDKFCISTNKIFIEETDGLQDSEVQVVATVHQALNSDEVDINFWQLIDEERCPAALEQLKLAARMTIYQKKA